MTASDIFWATVSSLLLGFILVAPALLLFGVCAWIAHRIRERNRRNSLQLRTPLVVDWERTHWLDGRRRRRGRSR